MDPSQVRAVVAARVSHVQGPEKTSHHTQRSKGDSYAEGEGWTVVGHVEDLDVSAIKRSPWERPDLRKWLEKPEEWDALIFAKTDRVFRRARDSFELTEWCKDNNKILVLIDDKIKVDYFTPESEQDPMTVMMTTIWLFMCSAFAELEGKRFQQRADDRVSALRATDRWGYGLPPFGYLVVDHPSGVGKALGLDPDQQKVLHWIARRMILGESLVGMVILLNEMAIMSPQDWIRDRKGSPIKGTQWTPEKLGKILARPSTQGIKMAKGKPVLTLEGAAVYVGPPSFDDDTWAQLQAAVSLRKQAPKSRVHSTNPQLGVAKCGVCKSNMRQQSRTTKSGKHYRYYLCGNTPVRCLKVAVRADDLDLAIEEAFLSVKGGERVKVKVWQPGSDYSAELTQIEDTIDSLREDRASGLFPTPKDQDIYRSQMAALLDRREALSERPIVKAGWHDIETNETYAGIWKTAGVAERRQMVIDAGIAYYVTREGQVIGDDGEVITVKPGAFSTL